MLYGEQYYCDKVMGTKTKARDPKKSHLCATACGLVALRLCERKDKVVPNTGSAAQSHSASH